MAVKSSAFGSVTLTGEDAKKFKRQVTFGKPKQGAKDSVLRGTALAESFRQNGRQLTVKIPAKAS